MTNWREREAGLRNRGSLTVWISAHRRHACELGRTHVPSRSFPGRQQSSTSNHAIETAATLGIVFHLSSRQS